MSKRTWRWVIAIQALLAMLGSLYYGFYGDPVYNLWMGYGLFGPQTSGFDPCVLCRYARILMYPLVWFGTYGLVTRDDRLARVILWVSMLGIALELYHYALQKLPLETSMFCTAANPCDALSVNYFGFMTIPFLCLVAFVVIAIAAYQIAYKKSTTTQ